MKALLALVLGLTTLCSAQASMDNTIHTYFPLLVEQSNTGRYCPELSKITTVSQRDSLEGVKVIFKYRKGGLKQFAYTHNSRQCMSDMVCITSNHYEAKGSQLWISLERNNDGEYPTTDMPGYRMMSVSIMTNDYPYWPSCRYLLQN